MKYDRLRKADPVPPSVAKDWSRSDKAADVLERVRVQLGTEVHLLDDSIATRHRHDPAFWTVAGGMAILILVGVPAILLAPEDRPSPLAAPRLVPTTITTVDTTVDTSVANTRTTTVDTTATTATTARIAADGLIPLPLAPISAELSGTEEQHQAMGHELQACMAARGFEYLPSPHYFPWEWSTDYGYFDVALAYREGYPDGSPEADSKEEKAMAWDSGLAGLTDTEKEQWFDALRGTDVTTVIPLPDGTGFPLATDGCQAEAETAVLGDRIEWRTWDQTVQSLMYMSYRESRNDPRVVASFQDWVECVTARGYPSTDRESFLQRWTESASLEEEIALAVADAECNVAAGLARTWNAVEVEIQHRMLVEHEPMFLAIAQRLDE